MRKKLKVGAKLNRREADAWAIIAPVLRRICSHEGEAGACVRSFRSLKAINPGRALRVKSGAVLFGELMEIIGE